MTSRGRILVVEDDPSIAHLVEMYLLRDGFGVTLAGDGEEALERVGEEAGREVVLAVVDIGLPGALDGLEVCRRLQAERDLPVVLLSARGEELDRIVGLEVGADDYVTKPFSPRELVARVRAVLRRGQRRAAGDTASPGAILRVGGLELDTARREVRVEGAAVELTTREYDLLDLLVRNAGIALSRPQILAGAWGPTWYGDERTVDVHVRQLRAKLGAALPLRTIRGVGYRLD